MIKIKKLIPIVLLAVLLLSTTVMAGSAFHAELETALVTGMSLSDATVDTTVRLGAKGESYSLDLAAVYNPEAMGAAYGVKGVGPSFSLSGWGFTTQLDAFVWPTKFARLTMKYKVSEMVNVGAFVASDMGYEPVFGTTIGIEY